MGLTFLVKLFCESAYSHNVLGIFFLFAEIHRFKYLNENIKINRQIFMLKLIFKVKQMGKKYNLYIMCEN